MAKEKNGTGPIRLVQVFVQGFVTDVGKWGQYGPLLSKMIDFLLKSP